jgi:hypothetical protein
MRSRCVTCIQRRRAFRFKEYVDRLPPEKREQAIQAAEANRNRHRGTTRDDRS